MFEPLVIESHRGPYTVQFDENVFSAIEASAPNAHFIVDAKVAQLYESQLGAVLQRFPSLRIEASEKSKSLDQFTPYVERLVEGGIRRGHTLVAIGGGIIQDITCFLAATVLRGMEWQFYPTTLLAQADSCIGSKSSINLGKIKNLLGTFTPPSKVVISTRFLTTLNEIEIRSGIGEMLKAHAIEGVEAFDDIASHYLQLKKDPVILAHYIYRSLGIKKRFIEEDEFDRGTRNIMNYGHSFGHAIESATDFAIPHGIAVSMGMDMANYTAARMELTEKGNFDRMHPTLAANYSGFELVKIPVEAFLTALARDKKNTDSKVKLILPGPEGKLSIGLYNDDAVFRNICADYLNNVVSR